MGAFSDLSIDIQERANSGRIEWAVLLNDEKRPATVWRVIGKTRGLFLLENGRGAEITREAGEIWIVA